MVLSRSSVLYGMGYLGKFKLLDIVCIYHGIENDVTLSIQTVEVSYKT